MLRVRSARRVAAGVFRCNFMQIGGGNHPKYFLRCQPPPQRTPQAVSVSRARESMNLQASCCSAMAFAVQPSFNVIFPARCVVCKCPCSSLVSRSNLLVTCCHSTQSESQVTPLSCGRWEYVSRIYDMCSDSTGTVPSGPSRPFLFGASKFVGALLRLSVDARS